MLFATVDNCFSTRALDIHEVGVWRLHQALELVLLFLVFERWVEEVDGESLAIQYQYSVVVAYTTRSVPCWMYLRNRVSLFLRRSRLLGDLAFTFCVLGVYKVSEFQF